MAIPVRPDPAKYRGGATSNQYKSDLAAYNKAVTVNNTGRRTAVEEDEEVVSLESSFDTEEDPFVPLVDNNAVASDDFNIFDDYARLSTTNQTIDATYADDPDSYLNTTDASGLPFMEYTPEMMEGVKFDTPDRLGDYSNFGGRKISGDSEEYETAFSFNNLLSRGIDEQTALDWYDNDGSAEGANKIISDTYFEKQEGVFSELQSSVDSDNSAQFESQYGGLSFEGKIGFLHKEYKEGNFDKETYKEMWRNEWNASQVGLENPSFIMQIEAPRDWDGGQGASIYQDEYSPKYEAGDNIWITTDGSSIGGVIRENTYFPNEVNGDRKLQYYDNIRPLTENVPDQSTWMDLRESVIKPGFRTFLAALTAGKSERLFTAIKVAQGETLHGADWANIALAGLEKFGVIAAPVPEAAGVPEVAGRGLTIGPLTLTYEQVNGVVKALGDKDAVGVLLNTGVGTGLLNDTLSLIGVPQKLIDDPDFIKGLVKGIEVAADGGSFEETIKESVKKYVKEGGGFGDLELTDGGLLKTVTETLDPLIGAVDEFGNLLNDAVIQPAGDIIEQVTKPVIEVAKDAGSALDDDLIQPLGDVIKVVTDPLGEAIETVTDPVIEVVKDAGSAAEDVARDLGSATEDVARDLGSAADDALIEPVKEVIESVELPDKPELDLSGFGDIKLGGLGLGFGAGGRPSSSRTTDGLFGKELFKFKTKIGVSPEQPLMQATERKQGKRQSEMPVEYADLFEDPFENPFNL